MKKRKKPVDIFDAALVGFLPEKPECKKPTRSVSWHHDIKGTGSYTGGFCDLTAEDSGSAKFNAYGRGSGMAGFLTHLTEDDLRCMAQQLLEAAQQLAVWRLEPKL